MRTVTVAQDMFDHLPSSIRNRFANDPALFLDFVQDADNRVEAIELGIFPAEPKGIQETKTKAEPKDEVKDEKLEESDTKAKAEG